MSVPSAQVQRTEIDIGFVRLDSVQGTTAVSAKPPGACISAAAATATTMWGSQRDRARPSPRGLDKPPRSGDYEVYHLPLLSFPVGPVPTLQKL